jgi:hypothetical protein
LIYLNFKESISFCWGEIYNYKLEKEAAIEYIEAKLNSEDSNFLTMFSKFQAKLSPFSSSYFAPNFVTTMSDLDWWKSQNALRPELVTDTNLKKLSQLMTACASTAILERFFSTFGMVHSKLWNQLGIEKAAKLVFLYKNYQIENWI